MVRPTKLTDHAIDRYLQAIAAGAFPETAARFAGFSPASLHRYKRGSAPEHVDFQQAVAKAETELEIRLAGTVVRAGLTDPRVALAFLERRFPDRWHRPRTDDPEAVPDEGTRSTPEVAIVLDPTLLGELIPRLLEAGRQLSGRPAADDAEDVTVFEDDGTERQPADETER
jgi:hypothetical protein